MNYKFLRYGVLFFLGFLMLYQIIPLGDHCSGLITITSSFSIGFLLFLVFLIILYLDIKNARKKKEKYRFFPITILMFFFLSFFFVLQLDNRKFWTELIVKGSFWKENLNDGRLRLYKDGSFSASVIHVDNGCTFQGKYEMKNDTLILKRDDLITITDSMFTHKYIKRYNNLIPIDKKFDTIKIQVIK